STSVRTASPTGVPPGSRVYTTSRPLRAKCSCRPASSVLLPAPSPPSRVIRRPRICGATCAEVMRSTPKTSPRCCASALRALRSAPPFVPNGVVDLRYGDSSPPSNGRGVPQRGGGMSNACSLILLPEDVLPHRRVLFGQRRRKHMGAVALRHEVQRVTLRGMQHRVDRGAPGQRDRRRWQAV